MRSGAAASKQATCKYFDQLSFLHSKVSNKPTESNLTPLIEVEDASSVLENPAASTVTQSVPSSTILTMTSALRKGISSSAPGKKSSESERIPYTPAKRSKSRADMAYTVDTLLVKTLQDMQEPSSKSTTAGDDDEDMLFCKSLVPQLKKLPARQNRLAKIKINQLLFDMEFNDEQSSN